MNGDYQLALSPAFEYYSIIDNGVYQATWTYNSWLSHFCVKYTASVRVNKLSVKSCKTCRDAMIT